MKDRFTAILAILLLVFLIGISYWYSLQAKKELVVHFSDLETPDFISTGAVVTRFDKTGTPRDKLFADKVEHFTDGHATAHSPRYYSLDTKKPQLTAQADSAEMTPGAEKVTFKDNVVLSQAAGNGNPETKIETSQLDAYPDTEEYKSDAPVKMTRGKDTSSGTGMDYDNVERTFKLRSRVQTVLQPATVRQANRNKEESQ